MASTDAFDVLPCGVLDSSHATDSIILTGWVLDKPVDPATVRDAWTRLVQVWPILVSRLVHDPKTGRWEHHIPHTPSTARSFGALVISDSIDAHYAYPRPSPEVYAAPKQNPHHLFSPYGPKSIEQILTESRPLVHLHVTVFDDASMIGLSVPHILSDGHGVVSIARALCALFDGVAPPPLDLRDPFLKYDPPAAERPRVPAPPHWFVPTAFQRLFFLARILWGALTDRDPIENRDVYIPGAVAADLKKEAMADIRAAHGAQTPLFVSTSDAVLAFLIKSAHGGARSRAPMSVFYTTNLRNLLELQPPYLRNTVAMPITPPLALRDVARMPLGALALHIRGTVAAQMTRDAAETWVRWRLANADKFKLFFSPYRGRWNIVTNWREMGLMAIDFSGALPEKDKVVLVDGEKVRGTVRSLYAYGDGLQPLALKNWFGLWADDPSGGIWTSAFLPSKVWQNPKGFGRFVRN